VTGEEDRRVEEEVGEMSEEESKDGSRGGIKGMS